MVNNLGRWAEGKLGHSKKALITVIHNCTGLEAPPTYTNMLCEWLVITMKDKKL